MLILTRKIDQGIVISGNILVRVLGVERDRVKIGISAPTEITVLRQELPRLRAATNFIPILILKFTIENFERLVKMQIVLSPSASKPKATSLSILEFLKKKLK